MSRHSANHAHRGTPALDQPRRVLPNPRLGFAWDVWAMEDGRAAASDSTTAYSYARLPLRPDRAYNTASPSKHCSLKPDFTPGVPRPLPRRYREQCAAHISTPAVITWSCASNSRSPRKLVTVAMWMAGYHQIQSEDMTTRAVLHLTPAYYPSTAYRDPNLANTTSWFQERGPLHALSDVPAQLRQRLTAARQLHVSKNLDDGSAWNTSAAEHSCVCRFRCSQNSWAWATDVRQSASISGQLRPALCPNHHLLSHSSAPVGFIASAGPQSQSWPYRPLPVSPQLLQTARNGDCAIPFAQLNPSFSGNL